MSLFARMILGSVLCGILWAIIYVISCPKIKLYEQFQNPDMDYITKLIQNEIKQYSQSEYIYCLNVYIAIRDIMSKPDLTDKTTSDDHLYVFCFGVIFCLKSLLSQSVDYFSMRFFTFLFELFLFFISYVVFVKVIRIFFSRYLPMYDENIYPCYKQNALRSPMPRTLAASDVGTYLYLEYKRIEYTIGCRKAKLSKIDKFKSISSAVVISGMVLSYILCKKIFSLL